MDRRTFFKLSAGAVLIVAGVKPAQRLFCGAQFKLADGITNMTWHWGVGHEKTRKQICEIAEEFSHGRGPVDVAAWYAE